MINQQLQKNSSNIWMLDTAEMLVLEDQEMETLIGNPLLQSPNFDMDLLTPINNCTLDTKFNSGGTSYLFKTSDGTLIKVYKYTVRKDLWKGLLDKDNRDVYKDTVFDDSNSKYIDAASMPIAELFTQNIASTQDPELVCQANPNLYFVEYDQDYVMPAIIIKEVPNSKTLLKYINEDLQIKGQPLEDLTLNMLDQIQKIADLETVLYKKGIIETDRDIENLLVNDSGKLKMIDFGGTSFAMAQYKNMISSKRSIAPMELMQETAGDNIGFETITFQIALIIYQILLGVTNEDPFYRTKFHSKDIPYVDPRFEIVIPTFPYINTDTLDRLQLRFPGLDDRRANAILNLLKKSLDANPKARILSPQVLVSLIKDIMLHNSDYDLYVKIASYLCSDVEANYDGEDKNSLIKQLSLNPGTLCRYFQLILPNLYLSIENKDLDNDSIAALFLNNIALEDSKRRKSGSKIDKFVVYEM